MCSGGGIFNFLVATDTAAAQAKVNKARTDARNAKNERAGAESELQRFQQALGNKKRMESAGRNLTVLRENLNRNLDAATYQGIMGGLALSEELGAVTAAAASAGVGGSGVEAYNNTLRTQFALKKGLSDRNVQSGVFAAREQMGRVLPDAIDSFDRNLYNADIDYTYYGPTKGPSVLGNLAVLAVATAASVAGAPQIGDAILKARTAGMQSEYGDSAGAKSSLGGALDSLKGGVGEVRDMFRFNNSFDAGALSRDVDSAFTSMNGSYTVGGNSSIRF